MTGDITMGANNISGTGTVTATTFSGDLNGTINTASTATTQIAGDSSDKIATTKFVTDGTSSNVSSINTNIQSSSNNSDAATGGAEYSATADIASGSRTFDNSSTTNTFYAGINLGPNSIVTITITQIANYGGANIQPVVTDINTSNNTFDITTYSNGSLASPTSDFTFYFMAIK